MDFSNLDSINRIEELLLQCRVKRHDNIITNISFIGEVFIKAVIITNDFQKPVIDPFFLYISMLPIDIIPIDSILSFANVNNKLVVTLYSNNNDNVTGIKLNMDLLKRMDIVFQKLNKLPEKIIFIDSLLKDKINSLRLIKDDWEFLQIYDCIFKTNYIFKKMTEHVQRKKITKEQNLQSIYYKILVKGDFQVPYLPIIGSRENASYIHYFNNNSGISEGSVILMDCGVKNKYGYTSDITRTIIDEKCILQKKIYNIVKKAQDSCV